MRKIYWGTALCVAALGAGPAFGAVNDYELRLNVPAGTCYKAGQTVNVNLSMAPLVGSPTAVVGFQAFVHYDNTKLTFVSGSYTATPFPQPVITPITASGGDISVAAGVALGSGSSTTGAATLVNLTFTALTDVCGTTITLPPHSPPSRFTDVTLHAVPADLYDSPSINIDDTAPTVTCPGNQTASADSSCQAAVPNFTTALSPSDNCTPTGSLIITQTPTAGTLVGAGVTNVTVSVKDCSGNETLCLPTFTVNDVTPPAISDCPSNILVSADPGSCSKAVSWIPPTAMDNCGAASLTSNHNPGELFTVGVTTVTYTAADSASPPNTNTCSFTVTVTDDTAPVITGCPSDISVSADSGSCSKAVSWTEPTATDNCTLASFTSNHNPGELFPVGVTTVTYTATDSASPTPHTSTCSFTVTVTDNTPPTISKGSIASCYPTVEAAETAAIAATTASDSCGVPTKTASTVGTCNAVITVTATDSSMNQASVTYNTRIDNTAPVIIAALPDVTVQCIEDADPGLPYATVSGGIAIYYNNNGLGENPANQAYLKTQFSAADVTTGAPLAFSTVPLTGAGPLTWVGMYNDQGQFGLNLVLRAPSSIDNPVTPVLNAYDNVNNDITGRTTVGPVAWAIDDYKPHLPNLTAGAVLNSLVRGVSPATGSEIVLTRNDVTVSGTVYTAVIKGYLLSDGLHHWYNPATPHSALSNFGLNGKFYFSGTLTYDSSTDTNPLMDFYAGTITITANFPSSATGFATATDNCTMFPVIAYTDTNNGGTGCPASPRIITRTWTATDECGNVGTKTQTITVSDTTAPVISAGSIASCYDTVSDAETAAIAATTASDNCGAPSKTASTVGTCNAVITVTATDACGNSAYVTYTTRIGASAPTLSCPANVTTNADAGQCTASLATLVDFENPSAYILAADNLGTATLSTAQKLSGASSALLHLTNGTTDFAKVKVPVTGLKLGDASGLFQTYIVPGSAPNLAPYMYFEIGDGASFVIAFVSGSNGYTQGCWFTGGINGATIVHVVGDRTGLGPNEFSSSHGGGLLSDLRNKIYSGSTTWGDLLLSRVRVGAGEWPGVGAFDAYVDDILIAKKLEIPPTASDTCGALITGVRSDSAALTALYPPGPITITWNATDCCGHATSCTQTVTVQDTQPPIIIGCPLNISVSAAAGGCTRIVSWVEPTASDNCTLASLTSDHHPGDTFDAGVTTVTYTATDSASPPKTSTCSFTVTVNPVNEVLVSVQLQSVNMSSLDRCVTFDLNCPSIAPSVQQVLTFTSGMASNVTVLVPCGEYTCISARDKLHTLRRTLDSTKFKKVGTQYVADFVAAGKPLIGGNLNDDEYVDILDFAGYASLYTHDYGTGNTSCSTPAPHADITGNGVVFTEDFTYFQTNFLQVRDADCCNAARPASGPRTSVPVSELKSTNKAGLAVADLNADGVVDSKDVALWIQGARPGKPLPTPPKRTR